MPGMELDMVRTGTLLYGAMPLCYERRHISLKGIVTIRATVALVKKVKAGTKFSYGIQYEAVNDLIAATVTIGYSDVLRLGMGKGQVLVNRILCPVIGSVCMDQLIIDITAAGEVQPGEEVVLLGRMGEEEIKVDDMGTFLGADTVEVYCHLTKRLPHLYIKDGKPWYWVDYIAQKHSVE
jgi:alanine racemase